MVIRIIVGLAGLLAIVQGLAANAVPAGIVPLALVVLGLVYGCLAIDAEDATAYLVLTLAVGARFWCRQRRGLAIMGYGASQN